MEQIIDICNLTKSYRKQKGLALDNISASFKPREITGIIGPNGAGKSTLIKSALGVLTPTSGTIRVLGKNPCDFSIEDKKQLGVFLGGKSNLIYHLSVEDSIRYHAAIYGVTDALRIKRQNIFSELLHMQDFMSQRVATLSLGQRLRAELLAIFIHEPKLIFLDEPTIGLDIEGKRLFRSILKDLKEVSGSTVILTTHDVNDLEKIADRILLIKEGKILFDYLAENFASLIESKRVVLLDVKLDLLSNGMKLIDENKALYRYLVDDKAFDDFQKIAYEAACAHYVVEKPSLEDVLYEFYT